MKEQVEILKTTRDNFKRVIEALDDDQLVKIPKGYRNNVLWNIGHALVTCDLLVYGRAGIEQRLKSEFIEHYRKGSFPDHTELKDLEYILEQMNEGVQDIDRLISSGEKFSYEPYMTSYNLQLDSWEDAVRFNNIHEALHLGYVMSMIKNL